MYAEVCSCFSIIQRTLFVVSLLGTKSGLWWGNKEQFSECATGRESTPKNVGTVPSGGKVMTLLETCSRLVQKSTFRTLQLTGFLCRYDHKFEGVMVSTCSFYLLPPDLAPSDCFLFPTMKECLPVSRFTSNGDIRAKTTHPKKYNTYFSFLHNLFKSHSY